MVASTSHTQAYPLPDAPGGESPGIDAPRAAGASATNAMQMRCRAHRNHWTLGTVLAVAMLVATWCVWGVSPGKDAHGVQIWQGLLILAVAGYLLMLRLGRKSYQSGVASRWVKAIHGAPLVAAALFGFGASSAALSASAGDLRLLALTAFVLCGMALPALAALDAVFRMFVALVMLPVLAAVVSHSPADTALNVVLLISGIVLLVGHAGLARTLRNSFRADVEQRALLRRLQQANQALSADRLVLQTESRTDALTALANRRYLEDTLRAEWNRCRRSNAPLSCILLDIDHFKPYNDHYGHDGGDRCLKLVADILTNNMWRAGDVVARYGGEEFVLLLPETTVVGATTVAELLKHSVSSHEIEHLAAPTPSILTVSLGVASLIPDADRSPDELLKAADLALYAAKRRGRNQVVVADEPILAAARTGLAV